MFSRGSYRGQFNKFVELSTLTPTRIPCRAHRCGQRIAGSLIYSRQHTHSDSTITEFPIPVTINISRAAFVTILSISVTIALLKKTNCHRIPHFRDNEPLQSSICHNIEHLRDNRPSKKKLTVTEYPISVTKNLSRAAFVTILSISVTITNR